MAENYSSLAKPTVLSVEDEAPLLTLLRYNLEKQGFRVDEAADGQEALLRVAEADAPPPWAPPETPVDGAGAAQRFSIGIVIVAGLAIGTLFTLFVLPVIYTFLASEHKPLPEFDESIPAKAKGGH